MGSLGESARVEQTNFCDYPVLRINETPYIEVALVKSLEAPGIARAPAPPPATHGLLVAAQSGTVRPGRIERRLADARELERLS